MPVADVRMRITETQKNQWRQLCTLATPRNIRKAECQESSQGDCSSCRKASLSQTSLLVL